MDDRLAISVTDAGGQGYRWADDEADAENIPADLTLSSSLPGGDKELSCTLLRDPRIISNDARALNEIKVDGSGQRVWQGSLARIPEAEGKITPAAVGDAALLKERPAIREIIRDADLSSWGAINREWLQANLTGGYNNEDGGLAEDPINGLPALSLKLPVGGWPTGGWPATNLQYDGGWVGAVAKVWIDWRIAINAGTGVPWAHRVYASNATGYAGVSTWALNGGSPNIPNVGAYMYGVDARRFIILEHRYDGVGGGNYDYEVHIYQPVVYGDHGLTLRGGDPGTIWGGDIMKLIINRADVGIGYTDESIELGDDFGIPHLVWPDPVDADTAIADVNRFYWKSWTVYDRIFSWRDAANLGRLWHVRADEGVVVESAGEDMEQEFNGVVVTYTDTTGVNRAVGPPGSGIVGPLGLPTTVLADLDESNPVTAHGRLRWATLSANGVTTEDGAIRLGNYFLRALGERQRSGSVTVASSQLIDEIGDRHPAWAIRAGDRLVVEGSADTTARLVVDASYNHTDGTTSVTLDAPPDTLEAILERLQVVLTSLG